MPLGMLCVWRTKNEICCAASERLYRPRPLLIGGEPLMQHSVHFLSDYIYRKHTKQSAESGCTSPRLLAPISVRA